VSPLDAGVPPGRGFPGVGRRRLWIVGAAFWAADAGLLAVRARLTGAEDGIAWPGAAALGTLDAASWALLCIGILALSARFRAGRLSLPLLALGAGALTVARLVAVWLAMLPFSQAPVWFMLLQVASNFPISLGLLGVALALRQFEWQAQRERVAARLQSEVAAAKLRMVHMQLQPHFVFNALDSISALMRHDVAAADRVTAQLGRLLRLSLERTRSEFVTLREELDNLALYLAVERTRLGGGLRPRVEVSAGALDFPVPRLILQPLVESAFRHGIAAGRGGAELRVAGETRAGGRLRLEIGLRGGAPPEGGASEGWSGITATRARLKHVYGAGASLRIGLAPALGTRVTLGVPRRPAARPPAPVAAPPPHGGTPADGPVPAGVSAPRTFGWYLHRFGPWYLAFWAVLALVQTVARIAVARLGFAPVDAATALVRSMLILGLWAPLGFPALLYAARFPIRRGRLASASLGNLAVGCGTMALYSAITNLFSTPPIPYALKLLGDLPYSLMVTGAIVGLGHLVFYVEEARRTESGVYRLQTELSEAELRMLQMQLQPHFLFNVLNSISALMRRDVAAADRMLRQVGRLLRLSLERTGSEMVPLREELEFLEIYLAIEQTRYQDRLNVRFAVSAAARDFMVPHLILQPLVENAIRHGIAPHPEPSELLVWGDVRSDERLCLEVRDWGAGLHAARPRRPGLGIPATRARLEQRYGSAASFEITSPSGGGTRVVVVMPPSPPPAGNTSTDDSHTESTE